MATTAIELRPALHGANRSFLPDPGLLWLIFRRRISTFLVVAAIILGAVTAYTLTRPSLYAAVSVVVLEPRQPELVSAAGRASDSLSADASVIDTEVQLLTSRRLAGRVAERLDWSAYPALDAVEKAPRRGPNADRSENNPLVGYLLNAITVRRVGLTYMVQIAVEANDPTLAAQIANGFAEQYIAQQEDMKDSGASDARRSIEGRLGTLRTQVSAADRQLQDYKIANGLLSSEGATMAEQEVSNLNRQIAEARALYAEKEGQLAAARGRVGKGGGGGDVPAALQSSTVTTLRNREAELTGELAQSLARYGELHPEVKRVRDELADTRGQLQLQINRVVSSLSAEAQAAQSRLNSLEGSQSRANGALAQNSSAQVGFLELQRNAEAAHTVYEAFLNRYRELVSRTGLLTPDARVETLAKVPGAPFSPNYRLAALFGLFAAMIGGLASVAVAEYLDARVRTRHDVEMKLRVRYAGAIPELRSTVRRLARAKAGPDYLSSHPYSAFAEAFRSLKTSLMLGEASGPRVLAITSALPREGKSLTSICLARTLAISGVRTLLVDCDARRRSVSQLVLPQDWDGLAHLLDGSSTLDTAIFVEENSNLAILGMTNPPARGSELFRKGQLEDLLARLRARFDVVILDTAPALGIAETRTIAAAADAVLFLAKWRSTSIKAIDTAIDLLADTGSNVTGLALTMVDVRKHASTGQQDVYSYHSKFAGYYLE